MAFDIWKGWPLDGAAVDDNYPIKSGEGIIAGMAVKNNTAGELVKADGTAGEVVMWAIQNQSDNDVEYSGALPVIVKNAIILTDRYETGSYAIDSEVEVSSTSPGSVKPQSAGAVVGIVKGTLVRDGITYLKLVV